MSNNRNSTVFSRAWDGFTSFFQEFTTTGPHKKKQKLKFTAVTKRAPILKDVKKRGGKLVNIKAKPAELAKESRALKQEKREVAEFEKEPNWNSVIEDKAEEKPQHEAVQERVDAIEAAQKPQKSKRGGNFFKTQPVSRNRKHLLFMNPGTNKLLEALSALKNGTALPVWAEPFRAHLSAEGSTLYYDDLEMATAETKREQVKLLYFDPKQPSTIQPVTDALREGYANISKGNVTKILRSLETYQLNFRRRLPPKVSGRMNLTKPGVICMDTFYPSRKIDGWYGNYPLLCCVDAWSRFSRVYVCEKKDKVTIGKGMDRFLAEFASLGHFPRMILADKGSELAHAKEAMEKYRKKPGNLVHNSVTGQPVLLVEAMQSQYQRRMAVFRTASLTDDPSVIMDDISDHLNNQKRPERGNLTPLQLLTLNAAQRKEVNLMNRTVSEIPDLKGLRKLEVGHSVRVLLMTRKEQLDTSQKGFRPKWSRKVYTILKKTKLQLNPANYRYYVGAHQSYYRHELLWVPKKTDSVAIQGLVGTKSSLIGEAGTEWSDEEGYNPDSD